MRTKVSQLEDEHKMLYEQKYTDENTIRSLRECLSSTEQYLKDLQEHATNLDSRLNEYKKYEAKIAQLNKIEEQKDTYIQGSVT